MADVRTQKTVGKGRHRSAMKRHRQSLKRRSKNKHVRSGIKTAVKKVRSDIEAKNKEVAITDLKKTVSLLAKGGSKGIIPRKRTSRLTSRLSKAVNALS